MAYCTIAQFRLLFNTNEVTDLLDDNADGTVDTGADTAVIDAAARMIWSHIAPRYSSTAAMAPEAYTEGSGAYPMLESYNAELAFAIAMVRQGAEIDINNHWVINWAKRVGIGLASVVAT